MASRAKRMLKRMIFPFLNQIYKLHMRAGRTIRIQGLKFFVDKEVFHPGFFLSSKLLKDEIIQSQLTGKTLLDIGSGSGILSIFAASKGAEVTAIDISGMAIKSTSTNADLNKVNVKTVQSDLWDSLPHTKFDYIVINPPYYPDTPQRESQHAWFCGENFEYFEKLFEGISSYSKQDTLILMVLSEDCQIETIKNIAHKANLCLYQRLAKKSIWETNFIFEIRHMN